jgi:hypothetical protein
MTKLMKVMVALCALLLSFAASPAQAVLPKIPVVDQGWSQVSGSGFTIGAVLRVNFSVPAGTVVEYHWRLNGVEFSNNSPTVTVPNSPGSTLHVYVVLNLSGYEQTTYGWSPMLIPCEQKPFTVSVDKNYLSPNSPITLTMTGGESDSTFDVRANNSSKASLTKISRTTFRATTNATYAPRNEVITFNVEQIKANCATNRSSVSGILHGWQIGPATFGPSQGEFVRVGVPVVLKNFEPSSSTLRILGYEWFVGGLVSTSSSYIPTKSDVGKTLQLSIRVSDPASGWPDYSFSIYSGPSGDTIWDALPVSSPTPQPSSTNSPTSKPGPQQSQAPVQPNTPLVTSTPIPTPTKSANVTSAPSPSPSSTAKFATVTKTLSPNSGIALNTANKALLSKLINQYQASNFAICTANYVSSKNVSQLLGLAEKTCAYLKARDKSLKTSVVAKKVASNAGISVTFK